MQWSVMCIIYVMINGKGNIVDLKGKVEKRGVLRCGVVAAMLLWVASLCDEQDMHLILILSFVLVKCFILLTCSLLFFLPPTKVTSLFVLFVWRIHISLVLMLNVTAAPNNQIQGIKIKLTYLTTKKIASKKRFCTNLFS